MLRMKLGMMYNTALKLQMMRQRTMVSVMPVGQRMRLRMRQRIRQRPIR